ncbi:hypothetical protein VTI74DRAFT_2501 [Chaetomium olivicolor]
MILLWYLPQIYIVGSLRDLLAALKLVHTLARSPSRVGDKVFVLVASASSSYFFLAFLLTSVFVLVLPFFFCSKRIGQVFAFQPMWPGHVGVTHIDGFSSRSNCAIIPSTPLISNLFPMFKCPNQYLTLNGPSSHRLSRNPQRRVKSIRGGLPRRRARGLRARLASLHSLLASLARALEPITRELRDNPDVLRRPVVKVGGVYVLEARLFAPVQADGKLDCRVAAGAKV